MKKPRLEPDEIVIIGGGVMGCAIAWRLASSGFRVVVLERSVPGAEASSAAAGILGAQVESHAPGPMSDLAIKSRSYFRAWSRDLAKATGIDVGFREGGVLRATFSAKELDKTWEEQAWQKTKGLRINRLTAGKVMQIEPKLSPSIAGGILFEGDARIDPRLFARALHLAAEKAGAKFSSPSPVRGVHSENGQVKAVVLENGDRLRTGHVVVAAGSWASQIEGLGIEKDAIRPARGQIVELLGPKVLEHVVFGPGCYLVPRDDGRVLVGSTLEFAGYQKAVTALGVAKLLNAAIELVPELASFTLQDTWSNFRPFTADERPFIGKAETRGLFLAAGHYRNGILLAPATAEAVLALVSGRKPPVALGAFSPLRASA